jgi:hypothetical protein
MKKAEYHRFKAYGGVKVEIHAIFTSQLLECEQSASVKGCLISGKKKKNTHDTN